MIMVGILMNRRIQTKNEEEFRELINRMNTPNRTVNIKETIEIRVPKGVKIDHYNNGNEKCYS